MGTGFSVPKCGKEEVKYLTTREASAVTVCIGIMIGLIIFLDATLIVLMRVHKSVIARRKQSVFFLISSVGVVSVLGAEIVNAWERPLETWPACSWGLANFLLWNVFGFPLFIIPLLVRIWRIICYHSTTVSFGLSRGCDCRLGQDQGEEEHTKRICPVPLIPIVYLSRMTEFSKRKRKVRGNAWSLKRMLILWLFNMFPGIPFCFFYTCRYNAGVQSAFSALLAILGIWLLVIRKNIKVSDLDESKSLACFIVVYLVFFIQNTVLWEVFAAYPERLTEAVIIATTLIESLILTLSVVFTVGTTIFRCVFLEKKRLNEELKHGVVVSTADPKSTYREWKNRQNKKQEQKRKEEEEARRSNQNNNNNNKGAIMGSNSALPAVAVEQELILMSETAFKSIAQQQHVVDLDTPFPPPNVQV